MLQSGFQGKMCMVGTMGTVTNAVNGRTIQPIVAWPSCQLSMSDNHTEGSCINFTKIIIHFYRTKLSILVMYKLLEFLSISFLFYIHSAYMFSV